MKNDGQLWPTLLIMGGLLLINATIAYWSIT